MQVYQRGKERERVRDRGRHLKVLMVSWEVLSPLSIERAQKSTSGMEHQEEEREGERGRHKVNERDSN